SSDVCSSDLFTKSQDQGRAWLVQVKIADGFARRSVLGFLHRLFKFLCQDVFLVRFLEPGVRELVFALAVLFGENFLSVAQVHVRAGLDGRFMREHSAKNGINDELCLTARARDVKVFAVAGSHNAYCTPSRQKSRGTIYRYPTVA